MSTLKAPEINISFTEKGASAIARGSRGVVLLGVKDAIVAPLKNPVIITSTGDIPNTLDDTTKAQIKLALIGYQTAPLKVLVYGMGIAKEAESDAVDEAYTAAQKAWKDIKFDYLAIPSVSTDGKTQEIATWVKSMRTAKKRIKAVLPNVAADREGVINYTINKNVYAETITNEDGTTSRVTTEYTAEQYCGRIAGLLCGTPLTISATYAPLNELEDCERLEDIDEAQGKGDSYKKGKIVDCMDLIADDLTTAIEDDYLGKYANSYNNKCVLISAIKMYLKQLNIDGIISEDFSVDFDIEAIKVYLIGKGKYTEEELAAMDDTAIAKLDTGSRVMLKANVTILDAMEDVDLPIAI